MTPAQSTVLEAVRRLSIGNVAPTYGDIARDTGMSRSNAFRLVSLLVRDGHLRKRAIGRHAVEVLYKWPYSKMVMEALSSVDLVIIARDAQAILAERDARR